MTTEKNQIGNSKFPLKYQLLILALGTIVALILVFIQGTDRTFFPDSRDYLHLAETLLWEHDYPRSHGFLPFFRPPLYPLFIAAIWLIFPKSILAILIAQCVIFGATALLLAKLAFFIFKNEKIAVLTGIVYCLNPFALILATDLQNECLHTLLVAGGVFLVVKANRLQNGFLFFLSGLLLGLASLNRPSALPVALFLFGVIFLFNVKKSNFLKPARTVLAAAGLIVAILPWTIANFYKTREFILVTDAGGYILWVGNHPMLMRLYNDSIKTREEYINYVQYFPNEINAPGAVQDQIDEFERTTGYYNRSLKEREKLWQNKAFEYMSEAPGATIYLLARKSWDYWKPYLLPIAYSTKMVVISLIYFLTFYILSVLGGINLFKNHENGKFHLTVILSLFAASTIVHVIFITMIRYRLPYVEPYLTILAASGFWYIFMVISKKAGFKWASALEN